MSKPDLTAAMAMQIERNDIVVRVARMIDPGAFAVWYRRGDGNELPVEPDVRKRYAQSRAICLANDILKLAATFTQSDLRRRLADAELEAWRDILGDAMDNPAMRETVERKHGIAT